MDTLSQILLMANIRAHAHVVVAEKCRGLVTASIAERLAGLTTHAHAHTLYCHGRIVNLFYGNSPKLPLLRMFNFEREHCQIIYHYPIQRLSQIALLEPNARFEMNTNSNLTDAANNHDVSQRSLMDITVAESTNEDKTDRNKNVQAMQLTNEQKLRDNKDDSQEHKKLESERKTSQQKQYKMIEEYLNSGMDALVIVNNSPNVKLLFEVAFTFLLPGASFCVYNSYIQPLAEVYEWLKETDNAINLRLSELWHREYQVNRAVPFCSVQQTNRQNETKETSVR